MSEVKTWRTRVSTLSPGHGSVGLQVGLQGAGPYLLRGCQAGKGTEVGVCDQHGLRKQAGVGVLGHLRLVAVEGWAERGHR